VERYERELKDTEAEWTCRRTQAGRGMADTRGGGGSLLSIWGHCWAAGSNAWTSDWGFRQMGLQDRTTPTTQTLAWNGPHSCGLASPGKQQQRENGENVSLAYCELQGQQHPGGSSVNMAASLLQGFTIRRHVPDCGNFCVLWQTLNYPQVGSRQETFSQLGCEPLSPQELWTSEDLTSASDWRNRAHRANSGTPLSPGRSPWGSFYSQLQPCQIGIHTCKSMGGSKERLGGRSSKGVWLKAVGVAGGARARKRNQRESFKLCGKQGGFYVSTSWTERTMDHVSSLHWLS
jgi:hypothetical protein